jgi:hypothetical protein
MQIALVLIDEVHLLNESRGAALEAGVVSRIKMVGAMPSMSEVLSCPSWKIFNILTSKLAREEAKSEPDQNPRVSNRYASACISITLEQVPAIIVSCI